MPRRTIILLSVLVGVVALIGGLLGIASRSAEYEATARVIVVPRTADENVAINAADTISRGPVASTFAEVYASSRVVDDALDDSLTDEERADVAVSTSLITDTSIVLVTATSSNPVTAEKAANAVARATPDLGGYTAAFRIDQIGDATGTATRTGASGGTLALLAIVVAAVLGLATAAVLGRIFPQPPGSGGGKNGLVVGAKDARKAGESRPPRAHSRPFSSPRARREP